MVVLIDGTQISQNSQHTKKTTRLNSRKGKVVCFLNKEAQKFLDYQTCLMRLILCRCTRRDRESA